MNSELSLEQLHAIGVERNEKHLPLLTRFTRHASSIYRSKACLALGWLRHSQSVPILSECVSDPASAVRISALSALMLTPTFSNLELLTEVLLHDDTPEVRARAARCIGFLNLKADAVLCTALKNEHAEEVITQIAYACRRTGCSDANEQLKALFPNAATALKLEIMRALSSHKPKTGELIRQLSAPDPLLRIEAIRIMADVHPDEFCQTVTSLLKDPNPGVRCAVYIALAKLNRPDFQALIKSWTPDPHPEVRRHQRLVWLPSDG